MRGFFVVEWVAADNMGAVVGRGIDQSVTLGSCAGAGRVASASRLYEMGARRPLIPATKSAKLPKPGFRGRQLRADAWQEGIVSLCAGFFVRTYAPRQRLSAYVGIFRAAAERCPPVRKYSRLATWFALRLPTFAFRQHQTGL